MTVAFDYEVTLATPAGLRVLTAQAEREVALMAESVLRRHGGSPLRIGVTIACRDPGALRRIASYLNDVSLELDREWRGTTPSSYRGMFLFP
ncbi:hypothetical protein [Methylobacterium ajmalii]|uniref:hypothetical protein n=1 Tax=Methylobacterium ajmalii TaxID=2738439 RepID=UPI00190DB417|nr:hypothetical protein [Methylobacterium ajmalii]MBK3398093.1 hypothetical protein [Methylobacterium ajmalii]MBK3406875.1 hypothetical protein [Methylobacterium ajmalii]MBK3420633.1 hypothetical protein [Methylobacterium ajmalii]MBZ6416473.1 hypothetical protein [Methylobacterium sp.]